MKIHVNDTETGNTSPISRLLTKAELAPRLGITTRTVDSWMAKGYLPFLKIGRTVRFRLSDVELYLNEHSLVARRSLRPASY
jgi:excisionase family DNA binding protein